MADFVVCFQMVADDRNRHRDWWRDARVSVRFMRVLGFNPHKPYAGRSVCVRFVRVGSENPQKTIADDGWSCGDRPQTDSPAAPLRGSRNRKGLSGCCGRIVVRLFVARCRSLPRLQTTRWAVCLTDRPQWRGVRWWCPTCDTRVRWWMQGACYGGNRAFDFMLLSLKPTPRGGERAVDATHN